MRGTPLSPLAYLAGIFGSVMVVALVLTGLVTALGIIAYGITFPGHFLAMALTGVAGAFCFGALGVAVSTLVPNEDAAPAIINFVLFPLLFISGTFGPVSDSSAIGKVANVFPVRHLLKAMVEVFNPFTRGMAISWVTSPCSSPGALRQRPSPSEGSAGSRAGRRRRDRDRQCLVSAAADGLEHRSRAVDERGEHRHQERHGHPAYPRG